MWVQRSSRGASRPASIRMTCNAGPVCASRSWNRGDPPKAVHFVSVRPVARQAGPLRVRALRVRWQISRLPGGGLRVVRTAGQPGLVSVTTATQRTHWLLQKCAVLVVVRIVATRALRARVIW